MGNIDKGRNVRRCDKQYLRRRWRKNLKAGKCGWCGKHPFAVGSKTRCEKCIGRERELRKKRYSDQQERGECMCGKPVHREPRVCRDCGGQPGNTDECVCGVPMSENVFAKCKECLDYFREYYKSWKEKRCQSKKQSPFK